MNNINKRLDNIYKQAYEIAGYKNKDYNHNKNTTLTGKFYEDAVRTVIKAINKYYPKIKITAPTGFVYTNDINPETGAYDQSNQTDIIVTCQKSNTIDLTSSDDGVHIKDVIAIIEVKKNFKDKNTFAESIWNTSSINKLIDYSEIMKSVNLTKDDITIHRGINSEIKVDSKKPSIIIFGFDGCSNEETIRSRFRELCEGNLEYTKPKSATKVPLKLNYLYEFPELIIDDNTAILKMTGLIQSHSNGLLSEFSSCGTLNSELKIYIFKITLLYAIIKHLNNPKLSEEVFKKLNSNPLFFITNPLAGINLNNDTYFTATDKNLISPYCEIKKRIKLSKAESEIYWNIHLGKKIESNQISQKSLKKFLSNEVLIEKEGILFINTQSIVVERKNKFIIYMINVQKTSI